MGILAQPTPQEQICLMRWRQSTLWVMIVGYVGYYLCRNNLTAALPLLSQEFHYSNTELGMILTISELAYAFGKLVNGPLADHWGGKKIFLVGMVGAILCNVLFIQFQNLFMFTLVWSLCRYFLSMGWGGLMKIIGAWYEPERNGTIMGIVSINFQAGSGLSLVLCSLLLSWGFNWQALFTVPAGIVSLIAIWSYYGCKNAPDDVVKNARFGARASDRKTIFDQVGKENLALNARQILQTLFSLPSFRTLLTFSFLTTFLRSIFMFWTAKFLVDIGMGNANAIMKSAIFPFLGVLGTVLLGYYTDRFAGNGDRAKAMWIMLLGLMASLFFIAYLVPYRLMYQDWIVFLTGASGFFLYGPYSMTAGCLTLDIAGAKAAGTAAGVIDSVGYVGGALAAWSAGFLSDYLGWDQVFYFLCAVSGLSVLAAYRLSMIFQASSTEASHQLVGLFPESNV